MQLIFVVDPAMLDAASVPMSNDDLLYFNGIDIATGGYGMPPMTPEAMKALVLDEPDPENMEDLEARKIAVQTEREGHLGVKEGVDPLDLAQAGWGVIFPATADVDARAAQAAIREALTELLALRHSQAGPRFRIYEGPRGHRPGQSKAKWLQNNGAAPSGPADPDKVPYYLLIVGSPEEIPYSFQYQLDVQYAVGRLWFPTVAEYASYARSVVDVEVQGLTERRKRRLCFFGARTEGDRATELSSTRLVEPLVQQLTGNDHGWEVHGFVGQEATHANLQTLLGGEQTPALLFTASHGAELPMDDPRQRAHQGALVCSDWPGPQQWREPLPERFYFAGEHLSPDADVAGMMLLCFACFGAGTPQYDEFSRLRRAERRRPIAPAPFMGALPLSLLGRGALAVIGHVDRAWGCSFTDGGPRAKSHTATFESTLRRLLQEQPVGHAFDYFDIRYAELSTELSEELQDEWKEHDANDLTMLWTANNDARGYVVLGDPAARLTFRGGAKRPDGAVLPTSLQPSSPVGEADDRDAPIPEVIARPPEISEEDWRHTPLAVQRYIDRRRQ
ncbi:hypothetical protein [Paraliomyxa miuraensis]|uniref:hypothetical protein n=1 Tax=Paraliomyxa miuraensis TaxID=376150 RepID=UPI002251B106|nr:hypothetical protein [Paraliomyxa miuraensis]MCX4245235.1 hypothetical protein [Paraliomyxa miuraensis]